ncbi:MAG: arsenate reductase (azurin) large subunit [Alphaproteobacteria bacterium]|nr:arsenate reductase (azurin) large subunit [Alphaproteobacteria bacterium]
MVVIDPRRSSSLEALRTLDPERVLHLRPAPGTDLVLANAMSRVVLDRRWQDEAFVRDRTDAEGFAAWREHTLGGRTPLAQVLAEAERITGVPRADIERAADWTHRPKRHGRKRTLTLYEKGVIWNLRNHDTVASVVQLAMLGGHVGRPGTGCGRQGGHQEGYVRPPYPGPRPPPNVDAHLLGGGGKALWVMGTNPYLTTPNAQRYRARLHERTLALTRALTGPRGSDPAGPEARADAIVRALDQGDGLFLVVSELYLTDTARDAHLVLPAAGWGEAELTSINCNSRLLRLYDRFVDPPGDALPDWEICARAARRMAAVTGEPRYAGFDWDGPEAVFLEGGTTFPDNRVDEAGADGLPCETYAGVTYAMLRERGPKGFQTPVRRDPGTGELVGTKRRFAHRFATDDGRFRWHASDGWTGYPEPVATYLASADRWPFWLTTGRTQRLWQTGYHDQRIEERLADVPLPYVELHPDDAATLGVAHGDLVEVHNEEGNLVAQARVLDGPPRGMVFALQFHPLGTANDLTNPHVDATTGIPWYKATRVAVRRLEGEAPAFDPISARPTNVFG